MLLIFFTYFASVFVSTIPESPWCRGNYKGTDKSSSRSNIMYIQSSRSRPSNISRYIGIAVGAGQEAVGVVAVGEI